MAKGRYYTPAARIEMVAGVEHKPVPSVPCVFLSYADLYVGEAEALERSSLLRRDMLPTPPGYSITWRPHGTRECGESWSRVPGYMEIRRHPSGRYHVQLTVSRQEQEKRHAVFQRESDARRAAHRASEVNARREYQEEASRKTPDDFRDLCVRTTCPGRSALDVVEYEPDLAKFYPYKFSADGRAKMEAVMRQFEAQIESLIRSSEVLPLHPEKARAGKRHLSLAWSAP